MQLRAFSHSDVGRVRQINEDAWLVDEGLGLFVVADGVGGAAAGEIASQMTCRSIQGTVADEQAAVRAFAAEPTDARRQAVVELVQRAIHTACRRVYESAQADERRRGMASTVALLLVAGDQAIVAHVGDSRVYLIREGKAQQLTEDHSIVAEQVKRGQMSRAAAARSPMRSVLSRAIGHQSYVEADCLHVELVTDDLFVICSDGLHSYIAADELAAAAVRAGPDRLVTEAVAEANARGGGDNITALAVAIAAAGPTRAVNPLRKLDALRSLALFEHLTDKELHKVLEIVAVKSFDPGRHVIREGAGAATLYVAVAGEFQVVKRGQAIATLGPGASFGEMALIDAGSRSADVVATQSARVLAIRRDSFFDLLRQEPELSVKLLWNFCRILNERLRETSDELSYLKGSTAADPDSELPTFLQE